MDKTLKLGSDLGQDCTFVLKEKERVSSLISINLKREKDTYSKMFNSKSSVSDFVKKTSTSMLAFKSAEEKEFEADLRAVDEEVDKMINDKISEFSFEVYPDWKTRDIKETKDIDTVIEKTIESYRILRKSGKHRDANLMFEKIKETKYAKEHLKLVMSLDFTRPTQKMVEMAKLNNMDLDDPMIIEEF